MAGISLNMNFRSNIHDQLFDSLNLIFQMHQKNHATDLVMNWNGQESVGLNLLSSHLQYLMGEPYL